MGVISHIQRFSIHDGPGIRTTVFFKGCPLSCLWCHNPETINFGTELSFDGNKCIRCGVCERRPCGAISFGARAADAADSANAANSADTAGDGTISENTGNLSPQYDQARCEQCFGCAADCPGGAITAKGRDLSAEALLGELLEDQAFYAKGGGVTLSGGEPTAQPGFCGEVLEKLAGYGIHTALDTSGQCAGGIFAELCQKADLVLFDVKHMDPEKHKKYCGVGNELILRNLSALLSAGKPLEIRIPLIAGVNDDDANISETANFLAGAKNVEKVLLLKYHKLGLSKPFGFGARRGMPDAAPPDGEQVKRLAGIMENALNGTPVVVR